MKGIDAMKDNSSSDGDNKRIKGVPVNIRTIKDNVVEARWMSFGRSPRFRPDARPSIKGIREKRRNGQPPEKNEPTKDQMKESTRVIGTNTVVMISTGLMKRDRRNKCRYATRLATMVNVVRRGRVWINGGRDEVVNVT